MTKEQLQAELECSKRHVEELEIQIHSYKQALNQSVPKHNYESVVKQRNKVENTVTDLVRGLFLVMRGLTELDLSDILMEMD